MLILKTEWKLTDSIILTIKLWNVQICLIELSVNMLSN